MARSVSAGQAVLEFVGKDSKLQKTIAGISKSISGFSKKVRNVGAAVGGIGAAITAPFIMSAKAFADYGDTLDKMSARTGISAQSLSEIGYAANISGASLAQMEKATAGMSRQLFAAQQGSKSVLDALDKLGVSLDHLDTMTEEDKFTTLVDSLKNIEDGTTRSGVAMKLFGLNGRYLLNMSGNMGKLREEAQTLGVTMSDGSSKMAADLTDSITRLQYLKTAIINKLGEAVAPMVNVAVKVIQKYFKSITEFLASNKKLIAGIAVAGAALLTLGGTLATIGVAGTAVAAGISIVGTAISAIATPIGLTIAAVVTLGIAFVKYTDVGKRAFASLKNVFKSVYDFLAEIVKNISTAFQAGGISEAVKTMWGHIKIEFLKGKKYLLDIWVSIKTQVVQIFSEMWYQVKEFAIKYGIAEPVIETFNSIQTAWGNVCNAMTKLWHKVITGITKAQGWLAENVFQEFWGKVYGQSREEINMAKEMTRQVYADKMDGLNNELSKIEENNKKRLEGIEKENQARLAALEQEKKKTPAQRRREENAKQMSIAQEYQQELAAAQEEINKATAAQNTLLAQQKEKAAQLADVQNTTLKTAKKALATSIPKISYDSIGTSASFGLKNLGKQTTYQAKHIEILEKLKKSADAIADNTESISTTETDGETL